MDYLEKLTVRYRSDVRLIKKTMLQSGRADGGERTSTPAVINTRLLSLPSVASPTPEIQAPNVCEVPPEAQEVDIHE